jgi:hypothetical protein
MQSGKCKVQSSKLSDCSPSRQVFLILHFAPCILPFAFSVLVILLSLPVNFGFCIFHFALCILLLLFALSHFGKGKIFLASIGRGIYNLLRENNLGG